MIESLKLFLTGQIQGVGFRPLVSEIATSLNLMGFVKNNGNGVEILLQGEQKDSFLLDLQKNLPPIAQIHSIRSELVFLESFETFKILPSVLNQEITTPPIPDLAICWKCQDEILNIQERRYFYPLINCTNCGPRFSVIEGFPYDRERTSMQFFKMCPQCHQEYQNPKNRFFHAQPISCPNCSPKIFWKGEERNDFYHLFAEIASVIKRGEIVCIQGIGGFHLLCDATQERAIEQLRILKSRPHKPLALMCKDINQAKQYAQISPKEEEILCSSEAPIVLLQPKAKLNGIARNCYGIMLAYTPIHKLLFEFLDIPLVATSANLKGNPIIYNEKEACSLTPFVLSHQREILHPVEDSIVQVLSTQDYVVLRNARGYAPASYILDEPVPYPIIALGANQKASFAIAFKNLIIFSPYIGDLDHIAVIDRLKESIQTFQKLYHLDFQEAICDLHPQYESRKIAFELTPSVSEIQHHFAHALSVCFEYGIKHRVLGFCFDGTGYGEDGAIWGGEVMFVTPSSYERILHFRYFPLLGGEVASREIWRIFFALLGEEALSDRALQIFNSRGKKIEELNRLDLMRKKHINSPQTSSVGRIFDAIAWVCGLEVRSYEAESGEFIESLYDEGIEDFYAFEIAKGEIIVDFESVLDDVCSQTSPSTIASKFLNTLANLIIEISMQQTCEILLCGGVFCNKILSSKVLSGLKRQGKKCYLGRQIPPNDNGIAIGQLYHLIQRRKNAGQSASCEKN